MGDLYTIGTVGGDLLIVWIISVDQQHASLIICIAVGQKYLLGVTGVARMHLSLKQLSMINPLLATSK